MPKKASSADAQIVLQLYDFRREAEMRKARAWFVGSFWPQSADDIMKIGQNFGAPENAWLRQVAGYWDMAAALVLRGALNEDLFFDTSGEMWFVLGKIYPYLKEYREKTNSPQILERVEKLATRTKEGRERLKAIMKRQEELRARMAGKA